MKNGRVWITRAAPGALKSQAAWEAAGFDCFVQPLISIGIARQMPDPLPDNAALLVTSQNALHVLGQLTDRRNWPVITVGDATANMGRQMGFDDVLSANGNADDLFALVQNTYDPGGQTLFVHASGSNVRFDLAKALKGQGYKARRDIYYENEIIHSVDFGQAGDISHIALYSPMAATAVRAYATQFNSAETIAISAQADKCLNSHFIGRRRVAKSPTEAQMIAAVLS